VWVNATTGSRYMLLLTEIFALPFFCTVISAIQFLLCFSTGLLILLQMVPQCHQLLGNTWYEYIIGSQWKNFAFQIQEIFAWLKFERGFSVTNLLLGLNGAVVLNLLFKLRGCLHELKDGSLLASNIRLKPKFADASTKCFSHRIVSPFTLMFTKPFR